MQRFVIAAAGSDSALRIWSADVDLCTPDEALLLLRNQPPFDHLRLHRLAVGKDSSDGEDVVPVTGAQVEAVAAALSAHPSLQRISLFYAQLAGGGALDAFVDAAVATRVQSVCFFSCSLFASAVPSLVRLLRGGALRTLEIFADSFMPGSPALLDDENSATFCNALRESTLRSLDLHSTGMWRSGAGTAVLHALTGHPTLEEVSMPDCWASGVYTEPSVALAALIAADAQALKRLTLYSLHGEHEPKEHDPDLVRVFDALSRNRHLESINLRGPHVSAACARQHVLPAVRACTTLRCLDLCAFGKDLGASDDDTDDDEPVAPEYAELLAVIRESADTHAHAA